MGSDRTVSIVMHAVRVLLPRTAPSSLCLVQVMYYGAAQYIIQHKTVTEKKVFAYDTREHLHVSLDDVYIFLSRFWEGRSFALAQVDGAAKA